MDHSNNVEQNFNETSKYRKIAREHIEELNKVRSNDRLMKSMERKFRTTFIGALSVFEQEFGRLWGFGLHESELSPEQIEYRKVWDFVRTTVLNNGNNQLRAARAEISEYNVEWNRHHMDIPMINRKED